MLTICTTYGHLISSSSSSSSSSSGGGDSSSNLPIVLSKVFW